MIIVKQKIQNRMNELQIMMESQIHLSSPQQILNQIDSVSKFWTVLKEEDREYIEACRFAIEKKLSWVK